MSKINFSAATSGFYPEELKENYEEGTGWPDDAVEITHEQWTEFTGAAPAGYCLAAGSDGFPCWKAIPPLTAEELIALSELEKQSRLQYANSLTADWRTELSLGIISDEDKDELILWMNYIKEVKAVETTDPNHVDWPAKPVM